MQIAIIGAGFSPERGGPAAPRARRRSRGIGTIHTFRERFLRGHGGERLSGGLRRALLQPDRGLRLLRLSREPCGELRAAGLCLGLAEVPPSGGLRLRAAELAADGLLRAGADRARRPRARGGGAAGLRQRQLLGQRAGAGRARAGWRCGSASARSRRCARRRRTGSPRRAATATATSAAVWRRAGTPPRLLALLAEADAFAGAGADPARGALAGAGDRRRGAAAAVRRARGRGGGGAGRRCRR